MKEAVCSICGVIGSLVATAFGGWSAGMTTLLICMAIDYCSGLVVAGVFKKSKKTENGALESKAGWKGLVRKGMSLLIILLAHRVDMMIGSTYIRDAVVIAFVANEAISIIENAGLMGLSLPGVLTNAIDVLQKQTKEGIVNGQNKEQS